MTRSDVIEWVKSLLVIILIAVVVRSFVVSPFTIPSSSMIPTLEIGDYLFVLRYSYGFRIPFTDIQIAPSPAKRGDVVVFDYPEDRSKDYIKRIVGVPGDEIAYRDNRLYINGKELALKYEGKYTYLNQYQTPMVSMLYEEDFFGLKHKVLREKSPHPRALLEGKWKVPEGYFFAMGDNRNNSRDSRAWGFVPQSYLVGKAAIVWWSWDHAKGDVRWSRIGTLIE